VKCIWMFALALTVGGSVSFAANAGDVALGKQVFEQCKVCHATTTPNKKVGPSLMHLFKRAKLKNGKPMTEKNVRIMINDGGNGMPGYVQVLSPQQRDQVIAYLKTL